MTGIRELSLVEISFVSGGSESGGGVTVVGQPENGGAAGSGSAANPGAVAPPSHADDGGKLEEKVDKISQETEFSAGVKVTIPIKGMPIPLEFSVTYKNKTEKHVE